MEQARRGAETRRGSVAELSQSRRGAGAEQVRSRRGGATEQARREVLRFKRIFLLCVAVARIQREPCRQLGATSTRYTWTTRPGGAVAQMLFSTPRFHASLRLRAQPLLGTLVPALAQSPMLENVVINSAPNQALLGWSTDQFSWIEVIYAEELLVQPSAMTSVFRQALPSRGGAATTLQARAIVDSL